MLFCSFQVSIDHPAAAAGAHEQLLHLLAERWDGDEAGHCLTAVAGSVPATAPLSPACALPDSTSWEVEASTLQIDLCGSHEATVERASPGPPFRRFAAQHAITSKVAVFSSIEEIRDDPEWLRVWLSIDDRTAEAGAVAATTATATATSVSDDSSDLVWDTDGCVCEEGRAAPAESCTACQTWVETKKAKGRLTSARARAKKRGDPFPPELELPPLKRKKTSASPPTKKCLAHQLFCDKRAKERREREERKRGGGSSSG